ncbi:MAG: hypothetical protein CBC09_06030 [Cellvibrionales bacterium TMED49]|nr:MAG: hypothetical protein CBC09_06030 [Cellvibrionales bacterium TMED49]
MHNEHLLISESSTLQYVLLVALLVFMAPLGVDVAKSVIAGCLLHILPNSWHGYVVKSSFGFKASEKFVKAMQRGQVTKFILTAALGFIITWVPYQFNYLIVFVTFTLMIVCHISVLAYLYAKQHDTSVF